MEKIIIIGGYGTALNIAEAIDDSIRNFNFKYEILGFANDNPDLKLIGEYPIVSTVKEIANFYTYNDVKIIFGLYKPEVMRERTILFKSLQIPVNSQINFIHPSSYISKSSIWGVGNVVLQNCTLQNQTNIGSNNIISSNVVIEHNTFVGNNTFIAAGAILGSNVIIENGCFVGLNTVVRENIRIKTNTFLGMGSLLLNNTNENEMWYGVPAQRK